MLIRNCSLRLAQTMSYFSGVFCYPQSMQPFGSRGICDVPWLKTKPKWVWNSNRTLETHILQNTPTPPQNPPPKFLNQGLEPQKNDEKQLRFGLSPLPGCNHHHQDYETFLVGGSQPKPSFATVTGRGDNPN